MSLPERESLLPTTNYEAIDVADTTAVQHRISTNDRRLVQRLTLLVGLVICTCVGIFFQVEVNDVTAQLAVERERVTDLKAKLDQHDQVIQRFNASVTNADVLEQIQALEQDLKDTQKSLRHEMEVVQASVTIQLNQTLAQLSATVEQAQQDISNQVATVKQNVEQYVIQTQDQFSMENSFMVYQLAGTFMILSCLISMWHMTAHLRKMLQPDVQRKILAILWMCPIYAITSWFSLVFHKAEGYLAIIKDGYEAYVIYQFLSFCIAVLGKGDRNRVVDMLSHRADHLTPPFRLLGIFEVCGCCKPAPYESNRALADAILLQCQLFAMQFVFLRPLLTTAMVVLGKLNYYGGGTGPDDYRSPQFYLTIAQNVSIFTAFTGLLKFYHAVDKDLAWCRPFAKFLCIKCVVFMTFWQGLAISILAKTTDVAGQDADEWAKSAQNFLICLEMLLFSIAHFYCFPTEEWEEGYRVKHSTHNFADSIALGDFFQDLKLILRASNTKKKKKKTSPAAPAIPEGRENDNDDDNNNDDGSDDVVSESTSVATTSDTHSGVHRDDEEEQRAMIARALEESLGIAGDDPDIVEAKNRLLESNILSPEMFDYSEDCNEDESESLIDECVERLTGKVDLEGAGPYDGDDDDDNEVGGDQTDEQEEERYDALRGIYSDSVYRDPVVSEVTSLLTPTTPTSLRPSIFTTVHHYQEDDHVEEKKETRKDM